MVDGKVYITASIMCANWMHLEKDLRFLESAGADFVHYDVMDGFFCQDYCLGTQIINEIRANTVLPSDYHLMVEEPARVLDNFQAQDGDRLSIHYEACRNLHRDLVRIRQVGFKPGVILNPATPLTAIEYVIEEVDMVTIMTVNPGYKGQKLVPQMIKKIEKLDEWRKKDGLTFQICVDGNVNKDSVADMVAAGGDVLVGGSSGLFIKNRPLEESMELLKGYVRQGLVKRQARAG